MFRDRSRRIALVMRAWISRVLSLMHMRDFACVKLLRSRHSEFSTLLQKHEACFLCLCNRLLQFSLLARWTSYHLQNQKKAPLDALVLQPGANVCAPSYTLELVTSSQDNALTV